MKAIRKLCENTKVDLLLLQLTEKQFCYSIKVIFCSLVFLTFRFLTVLNVYGVHSGCMSSNRILDRTPQTAGPFMLACCCCTTGKGQLLEALLLSWMCRKKKKQDVPQQLQCLTMWGALLMPEHLIH